jgi:hypothetical protein
MVPRVCVDQRVDFQPVGLEAATRDALAYHEISIDPDTARGV